MKPDFTKPLNELEICGLKGVFKGLPTYSEEGYIKSSDIATLFPAIGLQATPQQLAAYKHYHDKYTGGLFPMNMFLDIFSRFHDVNSLCVYTISQMDTNEDGFIDEREFNEYFKNVMFIHEPEMKNKPYEEFLAEADTNKDGKVSVEEFADWLKARKMQKKD